MKKNISDQHEHGELIALSRVGGVLRSLSISPDTWVVVQNPICHCPSNLELIHYQRFMSVVLNTLRPLCRLLPYLRAYITFVIRLLGVGSSREQPGHMIEMLRILARVERMG